MMIDAGVSADDQLTRAEASRVFRRAAGLLRRQRRQVLVALGMSALWALSVLAGPYLVLIGIDDGIKAENSGVLTATIIAYIIVACFGYVANRSQIMLLGRVGEEFLRDLRLRVFAHVQKLSMPFFDREKAGVVVSRMTSDVDSLAELVQMGMSMFVASTLLLVVTLMVLTTVSWQLLLLCLLALPPLVLSSFKFRRDSNAAYLEVRDEIGSTLSQLQEGLAGVRVVQAFAREDVQRERFSRGNQRLFRSHLRSAWVAAWYLLVVELSGLATMALALGLGGWWVHEGVLTVGQVAFFVLALSNLFEPVQQLSHLFNLVQAAGAGLHKLFGVLDTDVDVPERPGAVDLPSHGDVELDDVSFAYAASTLADANGSGPDGNGADEHADPATGTLVLRNVALTIPEGAKLALVGPTGAGKSTLAKLVARLYDPTEGSVRFDGVDLRDATLASLRERVVVIPQEGFLFNGTIRDNVRIARAEATDAEVDEALRAVGAHERFAVLPEGLDTEVRERGSRLSAGERQLVSLARAALADPAVLILDEATSSLDPGTERLVEEAVTRLLEGRTVVIIAHRLSTAARADLVGVVADGELVELGTHDELFAQSGHYAALYASWSSGVAVP